VARGCVALVFFVALIGRIFTPGANENAGLFSLCARSTKRQCEWAGCGRVFDNHPLFVAHVISEHCSRGPAQALEAGPAEAEALAIDQTNGR
jgi:hypothetical protein